MSVTIHTHHELSSEVRNLLEGVGEAELREDYEQKMIFKKRLAELGFVIPHTAVYSATGHIELYVSKKEQA